MGPAELARRKALWAERKADEAAASNAPWWMGNLRLYQNMASKFWAEYYALGPVDPPDDPDEWRDECDDPSREDEEEDEQPPGE